MIIFYGKIFLLDLLITTLLFYLDFNVDDTFIIVATAVELEILP